MSIEKYFLKKKRPRLEEEASTSAAAVAADAAAAERERDAAVREREEEEEGIVVRRQQQNTGSVVLTEWLNMPQFKSWLYHTQHGMFCRLCRQHKPPAKKGPAKRAFVEFGGVLYRKDYIERHITTEHHQQSVKSQTSLASGFSVMDAFEPTVVVEHEAVMGGFKCLYWLIKNELAHHTNYPKLLSLAELLGCDYFKKLKIDQRNNYRSHRIIDEMLEILGEVIEEPVLSEIQSSKAIALEVDESTDVSTARQLDLHVRYLDKEGHVYNQFLDLVELSDGKADTIVAAIKSALQEVKDTRWLSQYKAIENLQRNLPAVLAALAEEAEVRKCPVAKGLYTFCATYRFVAAVYLQADILPHLASLSRVFQKADVNFLHVKEMVPVTINTLKNIREAGQTPLPGSFLSHLHQDLDDPQGLGTFNIQHEEERGRRDRGQGDGQEAPREEQWARFQQEVMHPYLSGVEKNLDLRFHDLEILGAFSVLGPKSASLQDDIAINSLKNLARKFCPEQENEVLQEWTSFKNNLLTGAFKDKNQADILTLLASEFDEWDNIYPCLSLLASIALVIPVSSVNCERDFSTLNRVRGSL
ncbi:hypothetical protein ABVT39_003142 [Epinephelus coioides]